jgi:hypothetical protein
MFACQVSACGNSTARASDDCVMLQARLTTTTTITAEQAPLTTTTTTTEEQVSSKAPYLTRCHSIKSPAACPALAPTCTCFKWLQYWRTSRPQHDCLSIHSRVCPLQQSGCMGCPKYRTATLNVHTPQKPETPKAPSTKIYHCNDLNLQVYLKSQAPLIWVSLRSAQQ